MRSRSTGTAASGRISAGPELSAVNQPLPLVPSRAASVAEAWLERSLEAMTSTTRAEALTSSVQGTRHGQRSPPPEHRSRPACTPEWIGFVAIIGWGGGSRVPRVAHGGCAVASGVNEKCRKPARVTERGEWARLGSKQTRPLPTLGRPGRKSGDLQALLWAPWRVFLRREPLSAGSRVVNRWSAGVARAVNARRSSHLGCICVRSRSSSRRLKRRRRRS